MQKELAGLIGVCFVSQLKRAKESVELGKTLLLVNMLGIALPVKPDDFVETDGLAEADDEQGVACISKHSVCRQLK